MYFRAEFFPHLSFWEENCHTSASPRTGNRSLYTGNTVLSSHTMISKHIPSLAHCNEGQFNLAKESCIFCVLFKKSYFLFLESIKFHKGSCVIMMSECFDTNNMIFAYSCILIRLTYIIQLTWIS